MVRQWLLRYDTKSTSNTAAVKSLQSCQTLCDPIDAAHQAPPFLGFSRQEHWSGFPFSSPYPFEILPKIREEGTLPRSFYVFTLIPKTGYHKNKSIDQYC